MPRRSNFCQFSLRFKKRRLSQGVLPYKRLMGLHFHNWIDYNGVRFSIELVERGRTFSDFLGKTVLHIYS